MRVQKFIAASGFCSRRKAEELIIEGKVTVNGIKITIGDGCEETDNVMIGKHKIVVEDHLYIMLNKPSGFLTTRGDLWDRKDVMELIDANRPVYPVGRLDRDARGLLLLSSDGDFAQKVLHPRNKITKTYQAALDKPLTPSAAREIDEGVLVDRRRVRAKLRKLKPKLVEITIHEGRNKIVKRIFKAAGYRVSDLKRVAIGTLRLDVAEGKTRNLTKEELSELTRYSKEERKRPQRRHISATTQPSEGSRRQKAKEKEVYKPRVRKSYRQRSPEEREHPKKQSNFKG